MDDFGDEYERDADAASFLRAVAKVEEANAGQSPGATAGATAQLPLGAAALASLTETEQAALVPSAGTLAACTVFVPCMKVVEEVGACVEGMLQGAGASGAVLPLGRDPEVAEKVRRLLGEAEAELDAEAPAEAAPNESWRWDIWRARRRVVCVLLALRGARVLTELTDACVGAATTLVERRFPSRSIPAGAGREVSSRTLRSRTRWPRRRELPLCPAPARRRSTVADPRLSRAQDPRYAGHRAQPLGARDRAG